ncbi:MAG: Dihydroorotate dehydrogenase (quinone), mitochondrial [Pleopsidium flavum]|nr:MAG: Dihydroorotate dehydrogenase (quinone), mitochondrial [Pleopsidium flavum]
MLPPIVYSISPRSSSTITLQSFHPTCLHDSGSSSSCSRWPLANHAPEKGFYGASIALLFLFGYFYVTDTRAGIHQWIVDPSLRWIYDDAEEARGAATRALKGLYEFGIHPRERGNPDKAGDLTVEVFGHTLSNPVGISAGIDKHAEVATALLAIGPAVIELAATTTYPTQDGNPKTHVFRLPSQKALINRYDLNLEGADNVAMRLRQRVREYAYAMGFGFDEVAEQRVLDGEAQVPPGSLVDGKLMAVQVAENKFGPDEDIEAVKREYVYCVEALARYADIIVVNVSSPNTPGLRGLQKVEPLTNILKGVVDAAQKAKRKTKPPVMVKVSADEDSDDQISMICEAVWESGVDGVIVGNTTKRKSDLPPKGYTLPDREAALLLEQGGYSGLQLFHQTLDLVKRYRQCLDEGPSVKSEPATSSKEKPKAAPKSALVSPSEDALQPMLAEKIEDTVERDKANLKQSSLQNQDNSSSQPLLRLPERHNPFSSEPSQPDQPPALSSSTHIDQLPSNKEAPDSSSSSLPGSLQSRDQPKVIFATGGITSGKQALEILNAGASVAMVYTTLGGVGTISRIKAEMRDEIRTRKS